jgi:predicted component of type VI protein secretion system
MPTDEETPQATISVSGDSRTTVAMAERVAVLETKTNSLKEDTSVIRANIHGINNEMQKFVAAEMRCVEHLAKILEAIKDMPMLIGAVAAFTEMRPELREVIKDREQRRGVLSFGHRFALILGACVAVVSLLGGIGGMLVWLAQHLKPL